MPTTNDLQAREEWQRRVAAIREAHAPAGSPDRPHYDAGHEHGREWGERLLAESGTDLRSALFVMGIAEGLMKSLNAAIDSRN
ncbi:hypothetical protein [Planctomyces sp. SH-PL14]|uniref:hypothetical protein n=1 Tax=Planctomyces sp. SH-PL14 TaxID=1632864 RepID=UPI00078BA78A|nr:hypothetical protein [Planctomyces sp. SH-PL14]AMV18207.1 hypothetical protein VT03_09985 [Planctomyces sp. SH-PL14]